MIYLDQRFHEIAQEYDQVHQEVLKQREIENQLRDENQNLSLFSINSSISKLLQLDVFLHVETKSNALEEQLKTVQSNEQQLESKWVCFLVYEQSSVR